MLSEVAIAAKPWGLGELQPEVSIPNEVATQRTPGVWGLAGNGNSPKKLIVEKKIDIRSLQENRYKIV